MSTLLAEGAQVLEGVECCPPYMQKQSSRIERKRSGELSKQNLAETFVFSLPRNIPFRLFTWKNDTEGKGGGVKKINPRVTTDVDTANTVLLERVINLPPDACHCCVARGL